MVSRREVRLASPRVIAVGGRVASGKSHLARVLAEGLTAEHIEADRIRDRLASRPASASSSNASRARWGFGALASPEVYAVLRREAEHALASGRSVVADACFFRRAQREGLRSLARGVGAAFLFVECRADASIVRDRLAERDAKSDRGGWMLLSAELDRAWEPVEELPGPEQLRVDTGGPLEQAVEAVLARLASHTPQVASGGAAPSQLDAATFDCWNTLLFEPSWQSAHARRVEALASAASEAGTDVSLELAGLAFDAAWDRHMRLWREGVSSGAAEVAVWALAELGLRDPHPALEHLTRSFEEASHSGSVQALPDARETLEALARRGVRRALVCDTGLTPGRVVRGHLNRLGLLELLEVAVFSDEIGVPKPDPRAFLAALDPLGVAPQSAMHVGDLRRTDVAGARALGMMTTRIRARHDDVSPLPDADYVVGSHSELQAIIPGPPLRSGSVADRR
jgi:putative hydrolase of the HAD superfamily